MAFLHPTVRFGARAVQLVLRTHEVPRTHEVLRTPQTPKPQSIHLGAVSPQVPLSACTRAGLMDSGFSRSPCTLWLCAPRGHQKRPGSAKHPEVRADRLPWESAPRRRPTGRGGQGVGGCAACTVGPTGCTPACPFKTSLSVHPCISARHLTCLRLRFGMACAPRSGARVQHCGDRL